MGASIRTDVVNAVVEICGLEAGVLDDEADLETLGIDSLDLIEIGMLIEEQHGVEINGDAFADVRTFGEATAAFDSIIGP